MNESRLYLIGRIVDNEFGELTLDAEGVEFMIKYEGRHLYALGQAFVIAIVKEGDLWIKHITTLAKEIKNAEHKLIEMSIYDRF